MCSGSKAKVREAGLGIVELPTFRARMCDYLNYEGPTLRESIRGRANTRPVFGDRPCVIKVRAR
jgi:hypothetical protein